MEAKFELQHLKVFGSGSTALHKPRMKQAGPQDYGNNNLPDSISYHYNQNMNNRSYCQSYPTTMEPCKCNTTKQQWKICTGSLLSVL